MATSAITKALEAADRKLAAVRNMSIRKHVEEKNAIAGGVALGGAVIAGIADAKYGDKKIGPVPTVAAVAGVAAAAGLFTKSLGSYGLYAGMAGVGALCYYAGKAAHEHYSTQQAA